MFSLLSNPLPLTIQHKHTINLQYQELSEEFMFGIGMPEMIIILVIALIVIGPQKLPELAKSLGKGLAEFKRAADDFRQGVEQEAKATEEKERSAGVLDAKKEESVADKEKPPVGNKEESHLKA